MTRKILIAIIGFSVAFAATFAFLDRSDSAAVAAPPVHYFAIA